MKLASKLVLLFLCCLALVVGVFSFLSVKQAKDLALTEHERHAVDLAAALQSAIRESPSSMNNVEQLLMTHTLEVEHVQLRVVNLRQRGNSALRPSVPAELVVTSTELITVTYPTPSGQRMIYTYVPLDGDDATRLEVAAPESFWSDRLRRTLASSAIALIAVSISTSLVILLGGYWMVGIPLDQLVAKVKRVGQGDLSHPVELRRADELGRLGASVNQMCEQLKAQRERIESETEQRITAVEQLRHADRLRTVGRLAAGLAHEIGTPLNVISGRAELIAGGKLTSDDMLQSAKTIKVQSQRIANIVQGLLNFARHQKPQRQPSDLNQLLRETIGLLQPIAEKRGVNIELSEWTQMATAHVDAFQMQQVFTNLIMNAIQATSGGGHIRVSMDRESGAYPPSDLGDKPGAYWKVVVADDGCGIAADALNDIFEPFFTSKDVGEGTGLGLSIAYGIVRDHAGWIAVDSELNMGSTFTVFLPVD